MPNSEVTWWMNEYEKRKDGYKDIQFRACYFLLEARKRGLLPTPKEVNK